MKGEQNLGDFIVATKKLRADIEREVVKAVARDKDKEKDKKKRTIQTNEKEGGR